MASQQFATYPSLRNKNIIVTGGAEGIGAATVELFCRQGSKVFILDISESSAQTLIQKIENLNIENVVHPVFYHCDVTDVAQLLAVSQQILAEYRVVHVLVNNAAATGGKARLDTMSMTPDAWDFSMNVNIRHMLFFTQALVPAMIEHGSGSIINMGSITWRIPATGLPAYTASKAAIMGLTRTHSKEFGMHGIRVNSVMPGAIATERQIKEVLTPEYRAEVMAAQSLKRDLRPEEVAKVIVFLGSDEASAVTGSSYVVDGGWVGDL